MLGIAVGRQHGRHTGRPNHSGANRRPQRRRLEGSERVIADYAAHQHERQERETNEARETIRREIAERNRRNGWA
jgi:hypothetical protein